MSLKADMVLTVTKAYQQWAEKAKATDKSNSGMRFAEWFFWDELKRLAENKAESLRDGMIEDDILKDPKSIEEAGTHELGESKKFISTVAVTEPVQKFSEQELGKILLKNHKVPLSATMTACKLAKVSTNPRRTIKIIER